MRQTYRGSALLFVLLTFGTPLPAPPARGSGRVAASPPDDRGRFVVAFELKAGVRQEFVWPLETFPPARQPSVLLVVEEMPRVRSGRHAEPEPLSAARHLRINGRLRQPRRASGRAAAPASDEFVVALTEGRLRLSVSIPDGSEPDERYGMARVALYEIGAFPRPRE